MRNARTTLFKELWAFIAVAAIAFVGGLLIGDLGSSPKVETVAATSEPAGESSAPTEASAPTEEAAPTESSATASGAQVFASTGCGSCHTFKAAGSTGQIGPNLNEFLAPDDNQAGIEVMIVEPNSEVAEGYSANVMPQEYGQALSSAELHALAKFLVENSPAS